MWLLFACGSAIFAGVTAVLAKIGMQHINSTVATALRTGVVLFKGTIESPFWNWFGTADRWNGFIGVIIGNYRESILAERNCKNAFLFFCFCRNLSNYVEFYENQIGYSKKWKKNIAKRRKI